jgi:transposase
LDSWKKLKQGRIKRAQLIGERVFKKKEKHASFRYPQGTCLEQNNNRIWLPKLGWVRYRNSREGQGNRKTQAGFCCVECGYEANADLVAAINVRRAGLARIACEVNDGVSRQQQEPTSVAA